ncbi:hypothetical protein RF11_08686 [Thelohanellus kitauei]|uniref:Uncharacterized protein n=1 Tax=Thelohanellus kitauei TaxID=669202 RepID=A0A0C2NE29_THEKT|nr:hypothetical protein RF11_08686 [Thelohanellus kitauei]
MLGMDERWYAITILEILQKLIPECIFKCKSRYFGVEISHADPNKDIKHYLYPRDQIVHQFTRVYLSLKHYIDFSDVRYPRGAFLVNNEEVKSEIFWVIKNYRLQLEPTPIVGCEKPPLEGIQELALQAGESEVAVVYLLSF